MRSLLTIVSVVCIAQGGLARPIYWTDLLPDDIDSTIKHAKAGGSGVETLVTGLNRQDKRTS